MKETDEADNIIHTLSGCDSDEECTDITASYIRTEDYDYPDSVTVTVRIGNAGTTELPARIRVSFYDGDPVLGGERIDTPETQNPLGSG